MPLEGDFDALTDLQSRLEDLGRNWNSRLAAELGAKTVTLVEQCFAEQSDPYGNAWTPSQRALGIRLRRVKTGSYSLSRSEHIGLGLTLMDTLRLFLSLHEVHGPDSFGIQSDVPYANIQNYGWTGPGPSPPPLPARAWLPSGDNPGPVWSAEWQTVTDNLLDDFLTGPR